MSNYRVKDNFEDCLFSSDEKFYSSRNVCQSNLNNRFKCLTTSDCIERRTMLSDDKNIQQCTDKSNQLYSFSCKHENDLGCQFLQNTLVLVEYYFLFEELCNSVVNINLIDVTTNETDETNCDEYKQFCKERRGVFCENTGRRYEIDYDLSFKNLDYYTKYCRNKYPKDNIMIYRCSNSTESICVQLSDLCNYECSCPNSENEMFCPNRSTTTCILKKFNCAVHRDCGSRDRNQVPDYEIRNLYGEGYEYQRYCGLFLKFIPYRGFSFEEHQYPPRGILYHQQNQLSLTLSSSFISTFHQHRSDTSSSRISMLYYCNRGIFVFGVNETQICLCPPSYYGDKCQYQSERLSVYLGVETTIKYDTNIYKLLIRLQTSTNMFYDYIDFIIFNYYKSDRHIVYLLTPNLYESYSVVIDIFQLTTTIVEYHSSFYYDIPFPFLPVRRLATKIIIKDEKSSNTCVNKCSLHGRCLFYENNKNQFCFCNEGWTGELCDKKLNVSWGSLCQNVKKYKEIFVGIKDEWNNRIINKIPLMLVYFASNEKLIVSITVDEWYLYKDVHLNMLKKVTYKSVPKFVFVQTYFDTQYDTFYGSYYLVAYLPSDLPKSLTTNILGSNRCPYVGELLKNKTIMSYPYLKRIKFYYRPCLVLGTHCFYDERYMCLCNNEAFFDCFYFNHSASNCTHLKYCLNGGYCLQATKEKDFGCVCPKCYFRSFTYYVIIKRKHKQKLPRHHE
ncbi:unnamed protein product [Didymodactylos carnosus]|uniref:EGF-like domain-containing protein n=1 Tax=Didymodactylos carnosus TaxID=1234261 RepID=A0A814RSF5_9BILA|nr:unnamed protein product [Didymodactylos carnosus]CAF3901446.1 unnamed protein product [Didymodactylos carnosus]